MPGAVLSLRVLFHFIFTKPRRMCPNHPASEQSAWTKLVWFQRPHSISERRWVLHDYSFLILFFLLSMDNSSKWTEITKLLLYKLSPLNTLHYENGFSSSRKCFLQDSLNSLSPRPCHFMRVPEIQLLVPWIFTDSWNNNVRAIETLRHHLVYSSPFTHGETES